MEASVEASDLVSTKVLLNVDKNKDGKIDGWQFNLKNLFYTAEPIGSIKGLFIRIDGEKIDPNKVTLVVRGQEIQLLKAPTIYEIWWPSYEDISVFVEKLGGLKSGRHELEVVLHQTTTSVYGGELHDAKGIPYRECFAKVAVTVA